ncbi:MAG: O-antigen ligase family protein, partial [Acidimicrobiales bacterium]
AYSPVAAGQVGIGALISGHPLVGFSAIAAVMAATTALALPAIVILTVFPATFGYWRVGPASANLSLADVTLALGFIAALPYAPWRAPALRRMLRIAAVYAAMLSISVVFHPSQRATIEVLHRLFLVVCAVSVGAAVTNLGRIATSLRIFVAAAALVAGAAVVDALTHWPSHSQLPRPAYPWGIHKNAAGFLIACALVLLIVAQNELKVSRTLRAPILLLLFAGLIACQSRGSGVTLILVLLLWSFTSDRARISPLTIAGALVVVIVTVVSVNALFAADERASQFNSLNSRITTYDATMALWKDSKLTGLGLKYWREPALARSLAFGEPHNLVVSALGETGIIGLVALAYLVAATGKLARSRRETMATVALLLIVAKAVDSMLGIFWVAGTLTLPFLIVGIALGRQADRAAVDPRTTAPHALANTQS